MTPVLEPFAPHLQSPHTGRAPHRAAQIAATAARLAPLLQGAIPALYRLSDVIGALGDPTPDPSDLRRALAWYGHQIIDTPDGRLVSVQPAEALATRDDLVASRVSAAGRPMGVRELQRSCRGTWVSAWALRGCLERLTAAGLLVPVTVVGGCWVRMWRHRDTPKESIM